ncbi:hypothetical protein ASD48_15230 [Streptomyces sp. Root1310]|nr:hypothetical protein ASD48_15230 [Streptomyces sp. Root1310]
MSHVGTFGTSAGPSGRCPHPAWRTSIVLGSTHPRRACDAPHAGPARRRTHLGHDRFDHDGPDGPEATDDALSSPAPIVFGQTENRPRTSKAVFVATLED